ncbi:hypothetical protein TEA_016504 [Camellia sinensis var. sinensis]|uniref:Uncharacterized protein n=1 Tax=Camellia sinensis var. sinensis TaxID=542762 RepID=A0A4S4E6E0_CAMSN|nr:hypothetical protein TEA_016504 [Camellia sinensis var. sinensis]
MQSLTSIKTKFSSLKQKPQILSNNFILSLFKLVGISGLLIYLIYLIVFYHSGCSSASKFFFFSPLQPNQSNSPTNVSHLVFGLVSSVKTWKPRKPYIDSWWRPNVTRGYLFLDRGPMDELLPWPKTSPPLRISDDWSKLEKESKHIAPIMIRMVLAIWETFREGDDGARWYIMGFDDSIFFVDNWVNVLNKYDHSKYYYIGGNSETVLSNLLFSFDQGFGGGGFALSYPLAAAMVKDLKGCIKRYPYVRSHDTIVQFCVDELGVSLTIEKGIHQIDLLGDISGFLSSHPQSPLLSLHHLDFVNPIFPSMDRMQSTDHLMKAAKVDQSRLLQQIICYAKQRNWSFSVSWGYSVHIYEGFHPRSMLKRPLETFTPWFKNAKPPKFMFNTRRPCENLRVFFFESIEKSSTNKIVTRYDRSSTLGYANCPWKGNHSADHISKIHVFSSTTKLKEVSGGKIATCILPIQMKIEEIISQIVLDSDEEEIDLSINAGQSKEDDLDNSEAGVGATLVNLLTDLETNTENLGDTFIVSMIGEKPIVDSSNCILDASRAPHLTWQLKKGFISSFESDDESESDCTKSVESELDSS